MAHRQLEDLLRLQAANPNMVMENIHLSKFADEGLRQQREALATLLRERSQRRAQHDSLRATQMDKMSSSRGDKAQKLARDDAVHAALLKCKVGTWQVWTKQGSSHQGRGTVPGRFAFARDRPKQRYVKSLAVPEAKAC